MTGTFGWLVDFARHSFVTCLGSVDLFLVFTRAHDLQVSCTLSGLHSVSEHPHNTGNGFPKSFFPIPNDYCVRPSITTCDLSSVRSHFQVQVKCNYLQKQMNWGKILKFYHQLKTLKVLCGLFQRQNMWMFVLWSMFYAHYFKRDYLCLLFMI